MASRPPQVDTRDPRKSVGVAAGSVAGDGQLAFGAQLQRVVIENVRPEIDAGRFPIKRVSGEPVEVSADVFADGHDVLRAMLYYRQGGSEWQPVLMEPLGNDRWRGVFTVTELGRYQYRVEGWIDRFASWRTELSKKVEAGQDVRSELLEGAAVVLSAAEGASAEDRAWLERQAGELRGSATQAERVRVALEPALAAMMLRHGERRNGVSYPRVLEVLVDPERARFGAWYEMFPRSASPEPGRHGSFRDVEKRLRYIAQMGFEVLYLPPIHPIGGTHRKGPNNQPSSNPEDPGSPWAIGAEEGGHTAIHPQLGTIEDFRRLVSRAAEYGIEIALDIALQCSPDHPYVREHPAWFRHRPDGSIKYAENPPKKYQDIYPIDFETSQGRALFEELHRVVLYWIEQGVRIFRVDNPHTKPFSFWEWVIGEIKREHPEVIFLSEAFTRPKIMYRLAKLGFTQSYTYFAWRNSKWELQQYLTELTQTEVAEYFRPNLWPNTPDILTEYLQMGGRPAFMIRLVLAATLSSNYGIYGPAFELCENRPALPGSEEYLHSEKYEIRHWNLERGDSLSEFIGRVNAIRREHAALRNDRSLRFHSVDNDEIIAYTKASADQADLILVIVNLDPHHVQTGWVELPLSSMGVEPGQPYEVQDLLNGSRYFWHGARNYVELNPQVNPAQILRLRRRLRTERDFDYYM